MRASAPLKLDAGPLGRSGRKGQANLIGFACQALATSGVALPRDTCDTWHPVSPDTPASSRLLGPWMTFALVIGGVIGSGIFYLPVALAPLGGSVPIGWLISAVGVMAMAYCASRIVSPDGGGLQAYVEHELGPAAGFIVTWMTWNSSWIGVPAVAIATVAALARIIPGLSGHLVAGSYAF